MLTDDDKRTLLAAAAMIANRTGALSNPPWSIRDCVRVADNMLDELNKQKHKPQPDGECVWVVVPRLSEDGPADLLRHGEVFYSEHQATRYIATSKDPDFGRDYVARRIPLGKPEEVTP